GGRRYTISLMVAGLAVGMHNVWRWLRLQEEAEAGQEETDPGPANGDGPQDAAEAGGAGRDGSARAANQSRPYGSRGADGRKGGRADRLAGRDPALGSRERARPGIFRGAVVDEPAGGPGGAAGAAPVRVFRGAGGPAAGRLVDSERRPAGAYGPVHGGFRCQPAAHGGPGLAPGK